ncbi:phosphonopyruvate decarboxylase [Streptomyces phyllanthi]|uniref:Phosphonopyruvate decarboxylase n=1 Tax=Streptomyces phyllanthi TaxID=1803180 RepID=A0A5N8VXE1_9ACTN|nr:phosphonopyruvate decarboxylase [Streptomyces phyllanthi]MPY38605.1 phosphonopyruvate decarboxylase [Streptomyces phyllanthi]
MISAQTFVRSAAERGYDFCAGVPCSLLTPLINHVISDADLHYVPATSEGEAIALSAGAWLAGRQTITMCQNSGLGNMVNPLTSLNRPFRIPTLLICTWRGEPGKPDEPQHELMGRITPGLLALMEIGHEPFPTADDMVGGTLDRAVRAAADRRTSALVMAAGSVADMPLSAPHAIAPSTGDITDLRESFSGATRLQALTSFLAWVPDEAAVLVSTGKGGRELYTLADRDQHFYQVGSMGCVSAVGLGVALNSPRPVVVLDGDGAALMKLGNLATIGAMQPGNLVHIVLDNASHDSTGGQPTVSPGVDFAAIAAACGYRTATRCNTLAGFSKALETLTSSPGPHLVHLRIAPGSVSGLGRPTISPREVADRFRSWLAAWTGLTGGNSGASSWPGLGPSATYQSPNCSRRANPL